MKWIVKEYELEKGSLGPIEKYQFPHNSIMKLTLIIMIESLKTSHHMTYLKLLFI